MIRTCVPFHERFLLCIVVLLLMGSDLAKAEPRPARRILEITPQQFAQWLADCRRKPIPEALDACQSALVVAQLMPNFPTLDAAIVNIRLSDSFRALGRYEEAEAPARSALALVEKLNGRSSEEMASGLNRLASVLQDRGKLDDAEKLFREALTTLELVLGTKHLDVASLLSNLGLLLYHRGQLDEAESLLRRALATKEAAMGKDHPVTAAALSNLAAVLTDRGKLAEAEPLLRRALPIIEASAGKDSVETAKSLGNLAVVLMSYGQTEEAEDLLRRSLTIKQTVLGVTHPEVGNSLANLGVLLRSRGKLPEAELALRQSLSIHENKLGVRHPFVATSLEDLSAVIADRGKLVEAAQLSRRALAIREASLGKDHYLSALSLSNLALWSLRRGRWSEALSYLQESLRVQENILATSPTEDYAAKLLKNTKYNENILYGLPLVMASHKEASVLAMQVALLHKSRTLDLGMLASRVLERGLKTDEQKLRHREMLQLLRQRASLLDRKDLQPGQPEEVQQLLFKAQQIEQELARDIGLFRSQRLFRMDEILETVAAKLPKDGVLIEVVLGRVADYQRVHEWESTVESHYIALLLFPDKTVKVVDLGRRNIVEAKVTQFMTALEGISPDVQTRGQAAYDTLIRPMEGLLKQKNTKRLLVSPEGSLHLMPWGALHDGSQYLVDRYSIQYLNSGRDLLREPTLLPAHPALVLADPAAPGQVRLTEARRVSIAVAGLLGVKPLLDQDALEAGLRRDQAPFSLLVAAHGAYRGGSRTQPPTAAQLVTIRRPSNWRIQTLFAQPIEQDDVRTPQGLWDIEEAMHRSALALAPGRDAATDPRQDGWLTGEEVRELKLQGTQLVTLLACVSGRGGVGPGQGVYGLRRAFLQAGAQTVVSTLWSVEETSASKLVARYYIKLLSPDRPARVAAMEEAMKELRTQDRYKHPYFWAPFVVMGMDGPLCPPGP